MPRKSRTMVAKRRAPGPAFRSHLASRDDARGPGWPRDSSGQEQCGLFIVFRAPLPGDCREQQRCRQQRGQDPSSPHSLVHRTFSRRAAYRTTMPRIAYRLLAATFVWLLLGAADEPPAALRRGINITHWFRFPPNSDPAALRSYLDDAALEELKRAGFTFVRIPVQPELLAGLGRPGRCARTSSEARSRGGRAAVRGQMAPGDRSGRPDGAAGNLALTRRPCCADWIRRRRSPRC